MQFDLTIKEANIVLAALGRMPYEAVWQVVAKMQEQAKDQAEE